MSTNAIRTRFKRLISQGIVQRFVTLVNPAIFGYSRTCHLVLRNSRIAREKLNRIKQIEQVVLEVDCIGGIAVLGIAIKREEEEKIQTLAEAVKRGLIQNNVVAHSYPVKMKFRETDFRIIKCLISDARMEISEIAKRVSASPRTVSSKLAKMRENRVVRFNVATNALKMKGFIRFGMIIRIDRLRNKNDYQKLIRSIQDELESRFVIVMPELQLDDVINFQVLGRSIFEIDPALKKVESLSGVKGVDVFIPYSGKLHQAWILREIDHRLNIKEGPHPGTQVLTF